MSFSAHARTQAGACAALGSPFMARLLHLAAEYLTPGGVVSGSSFSGPKRGCGPMRPPCALPVRCTI